MEYSPLPDSKTQLRQQPFDRDFVDGPTNEVEFFEAVKQNDIDFVKCKLNDKENPVNTNATNSDGETALQIAAENSYFDIMKELVAKGATITDLKIAVLQCVIENKLECVKVLLLKKPDIDKQDDYITTTTLAAHLGRDEIVHFLVQNGYTIQEPPPAAPNECQKKSEIIRSQIAINRYRGLCSPVYICARYLHGEKEENNPLTKAFEMNKKVEERAKKEWELKKEYLKLSAQCKTFATDLYNGCTNMEEIMALLNLDEKEFNLSCGKKVANKSRASVVDKLRTAIDKDHKEFVAHPHTQQLLNTVVYSGVPNYIHRSSLFPSILLFILYTVLFPLFVLKYIVFPGLEMSQMMSTPYMKFISHISQFLIFLILNAASALRDNHIPTALEYLIFITVIGITVQEFKEMLRHERKTSYFLKWWNIITIIMLTLYILAALCWIVGFAITGGWTVVDYPLTRFTKDKDGYQFLLLGNSFFSLAIVVSVFHLVDLCQVKSRQLLDFTQMKKKPFPPKIAGESAIQIQRIGPTNIPSEKKFGKFSESAFIPGLLLHHFSLC